MIISGVVVTKMNPTSNVGNIRLFRPVLVSIERLKDNQSDNDDAKDVEESFGIVPKVAAVIFLIMFLNIFAFLRMVKKELAFVRATAMEGFFQTQKEHYGLKRINGRIKKTGILIIFFGIHTTNAVQLAKRIAKAELRQVA